MHLMQIIYRYVLCKTQHHLTDYSAGHRLDDAEVARYGPEACYCWHLLLTGTFDVRENLHRATTQY